MYVYMDFLSEINFIIIISLQRMNLFIFQNVTPSVQSVMSKEQASVTLANAMKAIMSKMTSLVYVSIFIVLVCMIQGVKHVSHWRP